METVSISLNFLALFIPAAIGVGGSFALYRKRQKDTLSNLREAFLAEMEGTEYLDKWPETNHTVPAYNFVSVSVYESNTDRLGALTRGEVSALVRYYTRAKSLQDLMSIHSDILAQSQDMWKSDTGFSTRKSTIRGAIDKLEIARLRAILQIKSARTDFTIPSEGDRVSDFGTRIEHDQDLLLEYGFAEESQDEEIVLSQQGDEFLQGEILLTGLAKEQDILDRETHPTRRKIQKLWKWLKKTTGF